MAKAQTAIGLSGLIRFIGLCLLAVLGYLLFRIVMTFTNPESAWQQPAMGTASASATSVNSNPSFNFASDPFNRSAAEATEIMVAIGEGAPETTLDLKLTGLITGENGNANLRTPDNKEASYRVGDEIISGVTLQAINKDYIVISVDGQIQRLTFIRSEDSALAPKTANVQTAMQSAITRSVRSSAQPVPQPASSNSPAAVTAKKDASTLFQDISLRRVVRKGQVKGYGIRPNRPGVDLSEYGFEEYDIVTRIGSTDITQGRPDFLALLAEAQSQGGVDLVVLRNGQEQKIRVGAR